MSLICELTKVKGFKTFAVLSTFLALGSNDNLSSELNAVSILFLIIFKADLLLPINLVTIS